MSESKSPPISVIIPAFNAEPYLEEAIASVLAQAYAPLQIIVIDDGSSDGTGRVAQSFGGAITYIRQENAGIGAARNAGLALATGDFVAFLDADDLWPAGRLARMLAEFDRDPALDIVFGHVLQFISPELDAQTQAGLRCPTEPAPALVAGGLLARRAAVAAIGPFVTDKRVGEFIDWYMRAQEVGLRMTTIPDLVLRRRIHGANTVLRERASQKEYASVLHQAILRRRQAAASSSNDS